MLGRVEKVVLVSAVRIYESHLPSSQESSPHLAGWLASAIFYFVFLKMEASLLFDPRRCFPSFSHGFRHPQPTVVNHVRSISTLSTPYFSSVEQFAYVMFFFAMGEIEFELCLSQLFLVLCDDSGGVAEVIVYFLLLKFSSNCGEFFFVEDSVLICF